MIGFQLDFVLLISAEVTCLDPVSYQEERIVMPVFLVPGKVCLILWITVSNFCHEQMNT